MARPRQGSPHPPTHPTTQELNGFCPWTIANRQALLLPGNPALGVVRFRGAYYVCVNREALRSFMRDPEPVVETVHRAAREAPQLIYLLRLHDQFPDVAPHAMLQRQRRAQHPLLDEAPARRDAATETPTHFVEKHIDPSYHWNEWELRRRAVRMANLRKVRPPAWDMEGGLVH